MLIHWNSSSARRRGAVGAFLGILSAVLGGCAPQSDSPPQKPSAVTSTPAATVVDGTSVLPPQSEPPVVKDNPADEDPEMADSDAADPASTEPDAPTTDSSEASSPEETSTADAPDDTVHVLFDGKSLDHWKRSNFGGEGEVEVVDGTVILQRGADMTGIHWTGDPLPNINYEVTLEAQRIDGSDFFCGIVFPVNESFCSFVAGGWGGSVIGLSSVDGIYAAENETGTYATFKDKTWYKFKLRVSDTAITAWIDGKQKVHLKTKGRKLSLHPAVEPAKPFGVSCYATVAGVKNIRLRELTEEEIADEAKPAEEK